MDRLSIYLTFATGPVLTGIVIVSLFSLGLYTVPAVLAGVVTGLLLAWPAAYLISRRIKRDDPDWDHTKAADHARPVPRPDAPEV